MPRPPIASPESVAAAISSLLAQGKPTTCEAIREFLGGGSQSTVAKLRKEILVAIDLSAHETPSGKNNFSDRIKFITERFGGNDSRVRKLNEEINKLINCKSSIQSLERLKKVFDDNLTKAKADIIRIETGIKRELNVIEGLKTR